MIKEKLYYFGETIIFQKEPERLESLKVTITGLLRYNIFEELLKDFNIEILADSSMTNKELLNELEKFYPKENQKKFGVIGIRFEL